MKKLMIAMAAAAMVGAANAAASYTWTANNIAAEFNGWKIMHFQSHTDASSANSDALDWLNTAYLSDKLWSAAGAKSWTEYYQRLSSMEATQGDVVNGTGTSVSIGAGTGEGYSQYAVCFILFEDGLTAGSKYILLSSVYYDGEKTCSPTLDMTNMSEISGGYLKTDSVPEPTSGLLMLLGMAGLCLRRKQRG